MQEIRQTFGPWAAQTIRLWAGSSDVEIEWTVGPIDIADGLGKEVISRLTLGDVSTAAAAATKWGNNETWETGEEGKRWWLGFCMCVRVCVHIRYLRLSADDNCREWQVRRYNRRSYAYIPFEPVSGNYAPVSCSLRTVDVTTGAAVTLATDRTQVRSLGTVYYFADALGANHPDLHE